MKVIIKSKKHGDQVIHYDIRDKDVVLSKPWYLAPCGGNKLYAIHRTNKTKQNNRSSVTLLHRLILGNPNGVVDHKDGNTLNNRRDNLRVCTQSQNCKNRSIQKGNKTGFKGVFYQKSLGRYRAQISVYNKPRHLGCFDDPVDAAIAYNNAALLYYGDFAKLNKVPCVD